ncbi:winged helix-turn-helix transcriptional regulator [Variovorax sp. LT2P21]|uniref:winged helix-turn-helix transcriptional regulator n=1 Tax=Variovorax sp. LT2P21 TaxID=3443731 RepID=UPI003F465863
MNAPRLATRSESAQPRLLAEALQRGELMSRECPSREVLSHVTSRWGVLLLVALMGGVHRFSELRRKVGGVSEKMLSQTLRWLEDDGLVLRKSYATVPPHVEYSLTPLGREVGLRVEALADWIEFNLPNIMDARRLQASEAEADVAASSTVRRIRR